MNKKLITSFVAGAILFSSIGNFNVGAERIDVNYGIKDIKIDNISQMPDQKPFTYKGTTFVPLRFIAEKLGQPIKYDAATQTVFIGEFDGDSVYLGSSMTHADYDVTALSYEYGNGSKTITDNLGNEHNQFLLLKYQPSMTENPSGEFSFDLNKKYTKFKASIGFTKGNDLVDNPIRVNIYADEKRIYAGVIERGELPAGLELDVTDAVKLRITTNFDSEKTSEVGLFDAHLIEK